MVGAVVVRDRQVVGEGYHARYGEAHAEARALDAAGDRARGATIYVSLEPCTHHGKTPPCADALLTRGIRRAVIAVRDPNPEAQGGVERLRSAGIEVSVGVLREEALELNAPFFHSFESQRPWITLKLAMSADSAIADAAGRSQWITEPLSRRLAHHLRAGSNAVAIGVGTVLTDDPLLTVRGVRAPRVAPLRVVFDRHLRTPVESQLVRTAREHPTLVVSEEDEPERAASLRRAGVTVLCAPSLPEGMRTLRDQGVRALLVEGGARLTGALLGNALVDRLIIFRAPIVLGAGALGAFDFAPIAPVGSAVRYRIVSERRVGRDTMTTYAVRELECSRD
jgi:diaminohydroxyphosphoribosylaminopyrimidine deaminase/5-amino-6-(5-phosphoribosylamino)uracil reductase